jgi:hypothetical protein
MDLGSAPVLRSKKIQSRRKGETSRIGYSIAPTSERIRFLLVNELAYLVGSRGQVVQNSNP